MELQIMHKQFKKNIVEINREKFMKAYNDSDNLINNLGLVISLNEKQEMKEMKETLNKFRILFLKF